MPDVDQPHDDQQDEEPVLDLEVPEDEARSVEGGSLAQPMQTSGGSSTPAQFSTPAK